MTAAFVHPTALVESDSIGDGTRVWAYVHILAGAVIGRDCNIGDHGYVEGGAYIGNNVTVKNHVCVWDGVKLEDDVFVGPNAAFTNDVYPRSPRMPAARDRYRKKDNWLATTTVERGATIGANASIVAGVRIGRYGFVAAGAVVSVKKRLHRSSISLRRVPISLKGLQGTNSISKSPFADILLPFF